MMKHSLHGTVQLQMNLADWSRELEDVSRSAVPRNKTVTYGRFVVDVRPNKEDLHRVRLIVGRNLIKYDGDVSTRSADLTASKCLWNSVISMEGARYMCFNINNFYLGTPMEEFEYLRIPIKLTPLEIITQYNLLPLISNGHIYIEAQKGVYGLSQAGILANHLLAKRLAPHGYWKTKTTPGLWTHDTIPVTFSLVMDDFGVKYEGLANVHHLIKALEQHYTMSKYCTGGLYCGITLKWDYLNTHVDLSMPGYITAMLHKYQHPPAKRPQYAPHKWTEPAYGQCIQYDPCVLYIHSYSNHHGCLQAPLGLLQHQSSCHHSLLCIRYATKNTQRCILSFRTQGQITHWQILLTWKQQAL
jgi:hypothetical protein